MFSQSATSLEKAIEQDVFPALETFTRPWESTTDAGGIIRIVFPEFTCVCPATGYPDFASIELYYLPADLCIELKSWKLYLNSFRMIGTYHEAVTAHLFRTVTDLLSPRWAMVIGDFFPRGNVDTTVLFETPSQRPRGLDCLLRRPSPHCREIG